MDHSAMYEHPAFATPETPEDLAALAAQRGWP